MSARRHGLDDDESQIFHALDHAITVVDLRPDADPPKVLAVGPDRSGNLLEIIWLEFADETDVVIHAMSLRRAFYELLPPSGEEQR